MNPVKRTRGGSLVELSTVFALFIFLLLGILDFGQFLFYQQALVERVRSAARWGALHNPLDAPSIVNVALYGQSTVPADGRPPAFGLTAQMVSVSTPDRGTDTGRLQVTLSGYSFRILSPLIAGRCFGRPITVTMPLGAYN